jgi:hypothetical protein
MHLALPKQKKLPFMRVDDRAIADKIRMPLFVVFGRPMVCALSALRLGQSVVMCVSDAGSEIHLSPTDLASPLPTQVKLEQFAPCSFWRNRDWARVPTYLRWTPPLKLPQ